MLKSGNSVGIGVPHAVEDLIEQLKGKAAQQKGAAAADAKNGDAAAASTPGNQEVIDRLDRLEQTIGEMNDRLRKMEASMNADGKSD